LRRHERPPWLDRTRPGREQPLVAGAQEGAEGRIALARRRVDDLAHEDVGVRVARRHHHDVGPEELTAEGVEHVDDAGLRLPELLRLDLDHDGVAAHLFEPTSPAAARLRGGWVVFLTPR